MSCTVMARSTQGDGVFNLGHAPHGQNWQMKPQRPQRGQIGLHLRLVIDQHKHRAKLIWRLGIGPFQRHAQRLHIGARNAVGVKQQLGRHLGADLQVICRRGSSVFNADHV